MLEIRYKEEKKVGLSQCGDFNGDPGVEDPRKPLKITGNPCWNTHILHFHQFCGLYLYLYYYV
jgi:hypothetical protein